MTNTIIFFIILLVGCLPGVTSDIYAPSLPAIALDFNTDINLAQWSMAIFMLGLGSMQLFYGPLSEGIGRRKTVIIGLIILLLGSLISLFAKNIYILIMGRFIQGCGAAACASIWRAIFRDSFEGEQLAKYGSYLAVIIAFIVPAAPTLGGYLQNYFGWRSSFVFLVIFTITVLLITLSILKETNKHIDKNKLKFSFIAPTFWNLLSSPIFMGYSLCVFICYGAFFAWFTAGPVLLIHVVGISPVAFGWISFLGVGSAMLISGFVNGRLVEKLGMPFMLRLGWSIMFTAGLLMLILKYFFGINTFTIAIPMLIFMFGVTFIWPSAFASAFSPFGKIAGYAGALYGAMQISGGAVIGGLVSYLPDKDQIPLALIFMLSAVAAWAVFEFFIKPRSYS